MGSVTRTGLFTLALMLGVTLSAAQRTAEAGLCSKLGRANQCVVRKDIKKDAINSGRVKDESLKGVDFKDGTITKADLAPGAITADDVFARTLVVAPFGDGADTTANGQQLLDAITFLGGVSPAPGAANPWTLKLEPGVYDVGANPVDLLPYVALIGTGQRVTEITGSVEGSVTGEPGVVNMTGNTAISHVTVTNSGFDTLNVLYAIKGEGGPIRVSNATAQVFDALSNAVGLWVRNCSDLTLTGVTAVSVAPAGSSSGAAVFATSAEATNLTATGDDFGWSSFGSTTSVLVRNSILTGANSVEHTAGTLDIAHSQLFGPVTGTPTCFGAYDAGLVALDPTCN